MTLQNKTIIITGASRGIGREIALRCAKDGANLVLASKSVTEGKLPGTIHSVADEVVAAGGEALAVPLDVRNDEQVQDLYAQVIAKFGRVDAVINNAGAIQLTPLEQTPPKRMDLMLDINVRGVLVMSHFAIPHLKAARGGHIINLSPPLSLDPKWFAPHVTYTISKFGMSMVTLGLAEELRDSGIAVNSLWPRTIIATAAIDMLMGDEGRPHSRIPAIMADAAYEILISDPKSLTGQMLLDEPFLKSRGYKDFDRYACVAGAELYPDLFVE